MAICKTLKMVGSWIGECHFFGPLFVFNFIHSILLHVLPIVSMLFELLEQLHILNWAPGRCLTPQTIHVARKAPVLPPVIINSDVE